MIMTVKTSTVSYEIVLERGAIKRIGELCDIKKRAIIVTDDGVPQEYSKIVAENIFGSGLK